MRSGEIKALTGLRFFAAVWVVLFHFRPLLAQAVPDVSSALAPVLDSGAQGVDRRSQLFGVQAHAGYP